MRHTLKILASAVAAAAITSPAWAQTGSNSYGATLNTPSTSSTPSATGTASTGGSTAFGNGPSSTAAGSSRYDAANTHRNPADCVGALASTPGCASALGSGMSGNTSLGSGLDANGANGAAGTAN